MKKNIYKVVLAAVFAFCAAGAGAQMKTSYFMEGSIPRYDMNAAMTPMCGYVNLPLIPLGSFGINVNNNFLAIDKFIYPHDGGHVTFMHPSVDAKKFMNRMPARASLNMDMNYNLLGFGKYNKKHDYFWSFGWNLRTVADVGIPKEIFGLLKDLHSGTYDIPDITVDATAYTEFVFGFAMPIDWQNLSVGGRLKILMGLGQAEAAINNIGLDINNSSVKATATGIMKASVFGNSYDKIRNGEEMDLDDLFNLDDFGIGSGFRSWGAAIDLGAEAKLLDGRLKVSAAVNDLGFIRWSGSNAIQAEMNEVWAEFKGYNLDEKDWDLDSSDDVKFTKTGNEAYSKRLSTTMNFGAEYTFLDNLLGVGLLSHTKFGNRITYSELTLVGTVRPADWFTASISQSMIHNKLGVLGFAFNFHPKAVNFFVGVDYIPTRMASLSRSIFSDNASGRIVVPAHAKSVNAYFGLAFGIGRKKPWK